MGKILNRYIAKEILVPFSLGLVIFTSILLMNKILKLTELVVDKGVKLTEVISLISFILPSFFVVTIPMAFLLAVLLAFGRLSTDEELTAVKSSGVSLMQMMPSVFGLSFLAFLTTLILMVYALPWGNHSFKTKTFDIVKRKANTGISPGRLIDSFGGMILYVNEEDKASGRYKGVLLSEEKSGNSVNTIVAREGEIVSAPGGQSVTLRLYDGSIHQEGAKDPLRYNVTRFEVYDVTLSMDLREEGRGNVSKGDRELGIKELLNKAKKLKEMDKSYNYLMVEFHKKFSISFACIVFAFIGAPLGIQGKRSGKAHGFVVSLLLITVYWIFLLGGEALGDRGKVPPFLGMWTPNILFLVIGIHLLRKANAGSEILLLSYFERVYGGIADTLKGILKSRKGQG